MDAAKARMRAKALIAQATDEGVTEEEGRSHAMKAARLIAEFSLLEEEGVGGLIGAIGSPEVGEAAGAVLDFVSKLKKSGLGDSLKRVVSTSRRAAASRKGSKRRRGL